MGRPKVEHTRTLAAINDPNKVQNSLKEKLERIKYKNPYTPQNRTPAGSPRHSNKQFESITEENQESFTPGDDERGDIKILDAPQSSRKAMIRRGNSKMQSMESSIAFETMNGVTTSENESAMAKEEAFFKNLNDNEIEWLLDTDPKDDINEA